MKKLMIIFLLIFVCSPVHAQHLRVYPSSINLSVGTLDNGALSSFTSIDGDSYNISELNQNPAIELFANFSVNGLLQLIGSYNNYDALGGRHSISLNVKECSSGSFKHIGTIQPSGVFTYTNFTFNNSFNCGGLVQTQWIHNQSGNINHDWLIETMFVEYERVIKITMNDMNIYSYDIKALSKLSDKFKNENIVSLYENNIFVSSTDTNGVLDLTNPHQNYTIAIKPSKSQSMSGFITMNSLVESYFAPIISILLLLLLIGLFKSKK